MDDIQYLSNRHKRDFLGYEHIVQSVLVYKLTEQDKALNLDEDYLSKQHRAPTQGVTAIGKAKCVKRCTKDQRH